MTETVSGVNRQPPRGEISGLAESARPDCKSRGLKSSALRQAQLVAGGLLLAAAFYSPLWVLTPVVGAGLALAGLSGVCPMERLLARAPWNRA